MMGALTIGIIIVAVLISALIATQMAAVTMIDGFEHPDYRHIATLSQSAPDAFVTATIDRNLYGPQLVITRGKIGSKALVWEFLKWIVQMTPLSSQALPINTDIQRRLVILRDNSSGSDGNGNPPAAMVGIEADNTVYRKSTTYRLEQDAAGEPILEEDDVIAEDTWQNTMLDGTEYGYLHTATNLHFAYDSDSGVAAHTVQIGVIARQVEVDLTELLFDQVTIESLVRAATILLN